MFRRLDISRSALALTLFTTTLVASSALATPPPRSSAGLAYDPGSQRLVLFGGFSDPDRASIRYGYNDTWEWTGNRWVLMAPAQHPSGRAGVVMVTDPNRGHIVLFGGGTGENDNHNDTWTYTRGEWTRLETPDAPSPRRFAAGAFDPARDRLIIFGGLTGKSTALRDTWEFDGTTWRQIDEEGPDIAGPSLVVDEDSGEILLIGMSVTSSTEFETRTYRWTDGEWVRLEPETSPPCTSQSAVVWQQHNGEILLSGGACPTGAVSSEVFVWRDENWVEVETSGTIGAVTSHSIAYDPVRRESIIFGGNEGFAFNRSSTHRYRDGRWRIEPTSGFHPGARTLAVFETATFNGETAQYLFGGLEAGFQRNDLWKLVGTNWQRVRTEGGPTDCGFPVGAFDSDRQRLVISCADGKLWEFDGSAWKQFSDLKPAPENRRWASMEYDPVRRRTVLFGGFAGFSYLNDTWLWDGTRWTRAEKSGAPDGRALTTMFWDPIQKRMTIFGGIGRKSDNDRIQRYGDMWVFDGTRWSEVKPASSPGPRYGAQAEWDPSRERVVMFGGKSGEEIYLGEEWEWNGTTWSRVDSVNAPTPRMNAAMAWDPVSGSLIHFGGYAGLHFADLFFVRDGVWSAVPYRPLRVRPVRPPRAGADSVVRPGVSRSSLD